MEGKSISVGDEFLVVAIGDKDMLVLMRQCCIKKDMGSMREVFGGVGSYLLYVPIAKAAQVNRDLLSLEDPSSCRTL